MTDLIINSEESRQEALSLIWRLNITKPWALTVKKKQKLRSLSQNATLHMWCNYIADEVGDDTESVKDEFKRMFLPMIERVSRLTGEVTMHPTHTSGLEVPDFAKFLDKIHAFSTTTLGIQLPLPDDLRYGDQPNEGEKVG